jgi:hypothetical protein
MPVGLPGEKDVKRVTKSGKRRSFLVDLERRLVDIALNDDRILVVGVLPEVQA